MFGASLTTKTKLCINDSCVTFLKRDIKELVELDY